MDILLEYSFLIASELYFLWNQDGTKFSSFNKEKWDYEQMKVMVQDVQLPAMFVDLDILEQNVR